LFGGAGNDKLNGGVGNDVYLLAKGAGIDTISDYDTTVGNSDVVQFVDVKSTEVTSMECVGDNLVIKYGAADQVSIIDYFSTSYPGSKVEQFKFSDGVTWDDAFIKATVTITGDAAVNTLYGRNDITNRMFGLDGNDTLNGGALADVLNGGNGDDILNGAAGADTLLGGAGNDKLNGDVGNDLYLLAKGAGIDTITDYDTTVGNSDVVQFVDVKSTEVTSMECVGDNLVIKYGTADQVSVIDYFSTSYPGSKVEQFQFSDGVTWDDAFIKATVTITGDAAVNTLYGRNDITNRMFGLDGNDTLNGGALADVLNGGNGDDILNGAAGADTLIGGAGNDKLNGGVGNDLYLLAKGAGIDAISENDTTVGNSDVVQFVDVKSTEVTSMECVGDNLVIKYGTADQVSIIDYFSTSYPGSKVEQFKFSDGVMWDETVIKATVTITGNTLNNTLYGRNDITNRIYGLDGNDTLNGGALADVLNGGNGDDILNGGSGNDILQGAIGLDSLNDTVGNNVLDGGVGNDIITAGAGNDFIAGGVGNDTITTGQGSDVIAFNLGDGMDIVNASTLTGNSLSLGKGITYADLLFKKSANDLILVTGASEQITVKDWYANTANHSIANLQIVIEGTSDYVAASTNKLNNKKIEQFNFDGLVTKFDQARAATPTMTSWSLSASLLEFYLAGSDTAAIGGDLAYQYAKDGNLSTFSATPAQSLVASPQFGAAQGLQNVAALQDASPRLM
jgi:Ca2+-binding RTX toxin-like protein